MTSVEVAIVGGGPAGAATAALLARAGHEVALFERSAEPRWRACGVFASPAATAALRRVGLSGERLAALARPIAAMRVETLAGTSFRLTYGDDGSLRAPAVGFDRPALDRELLALAAAAGARVCTGAAVTNVTLAGAHASLTVRTGGVGEEVRARVVVGADGIRSIVARTAGVARAARLAPRVGLTYHLPDERAGGAPDARMVVLDGAYCGLAPVPGGRLNVGIVLASSSWRRALARDGGVALASRVIAALPVAADDPAGLRAAEPCDSIVGAAPLGHRVTRRAGRNWLLAGDAAGFLDPFTGEGLHRAFVSAELAAETIDAHLRRNRPMTAYAKRMRGRFAAKDLATLVVQAFVARPALFDYAARRLARRTGVRETMGLVMGDLVPASRALDPRFLAALLRP